MKKLLFLTFCSVLALAIAGQADAYNSFKAKRAMGAVAVAAQAAVPSAAVTITDCGGKPTTAFYTVSSVFLNTSCTSLNTPEQCCTGLNTGNCAASVKLDYAVCKSSAECEAFTIGTALVADTSVGTDPQLWHSVEWPDVVHAPLVKVQATGLTNNPSDTVVTVDVVCGE